MPKYPSSVNSQKKPLFLLFLSFLFAGIIGFFLGTYYHPNVLQIIEKQPPTPTPNSEQAAYIEGGSPLDKRQVAGQEATSNSIYFHGSRDKKEIALTFDAEMTDAMRQYVLNGGSSYDPQIISTLIQTNTKATLFLTGMWVMLYPNQTRSFAQNPLFEIGSHSFSDTSYSGFCYGLAQIPDTQDLEEIEATQKILSDTAGVTNKLFRFPGGCYNAKDVAIVTKTAGLTIVHWDVVGGDGFNQNANMIVRNVVDNVQNGSIIVLHLNGAPNAPKTAEALPQIIQQLKAKGYTFVKVSELLNL